MGTALNIATNLTAQASLALVANQVVPGTLAFHLATNAVARTNGFPELTNATTEVSGWTYDYYAGPGLAKLTNAVWSTNFWLHGVHGLSGTTIGYSNQLGGKFMVTLISPRHFLGAQHVTLGVGTLTAFLGTNNMLYWRSVVQTVNAGDDTSVGLLNADLPPAVEYLPLLPTNAASYFPTNESLPLQGIGMNQDLRVFSEPIRFNSHVARVNWSAEAHIPYGLSTNWSVQIRSGDSSCPQRILIGNQLVLVSDNWFAFLGPDYAAKSATINRLMHYLSTNNAAATDYQVTFVSLTNWPAHQP